MIKSKSKESVVDRPTVYIFAVGAGCTSAILLSITVKHNASMHACHNPTCFQWPTLLHARHPTMCPPCLLGRVRTGRNLRWCRRVIAIIARLFKIAPLNTSLRILLLLFCDIFVVFALVGCMLGVARRVTNGHANTNLGTPLVLVHYHMGLCSVRLLTKVSKAPLEFSTRSSSKTILPSSNKSTIVLPPNLK